MTLPILFIFYVTFFVLYLTPNWLTLISKKLASFQHCLWHVNMLWHNKPLTYFLQFFFLFSFTILFLLFQWYSMRELLGNVYNTIVGWLYYTVTNNIFEITLSSFSSSIINSKAFCHKEISPFFFCSHFTRSTICYDWNIWFQWKYMQMRKGKEKNNKYKWIVFFLPFFITNVLRILNKRTPLVPLLAFFPALLLTFLLGIRIFFNSWYKF